MVACGFPVSSGQKRYMDTVPYTLEREQASSFYTTERQWRTAEELEPGALEAARQKTRRFLGVLSLASTVKVEPVYDAPPSATLLGSLHVAAKGDISALEAVMVNARTNVAEMLYKAGHQTRVELELMGGRLAQGGVLLADIQANALKYGQLNGIMLGRTKQEIENVHTFEELLAGDVMDTHDAVVFSVSPEDEYTKRNHGFYAETETCSIQLLKKQEGSDTIILETALVAGKAHSHARRHDIQAVNALLKRGGSSARVATSEDSLRHIVLVPKGGTTQGIERVVEAYDNAVGGVFYGQAMQDDRSPRDYVSHAVECAKKNDAFDDIVHSITNQLIKESHHLTSPRAATMRLHELTKDALVHRAVLDDTIDGRVFGARAASLIASSRQATAEGRSVLAKELQEKAIEVSVATSCPMFFGAGAQESSGLEKNGDPLLSLFGSDRRGPLAFRCPKKNCLNVRTPNGSLISTCQRCGAQIPKC